MTMTHESDRFPPMQSRLTSHDIRVKKIFSEKNQFFCCRYERRGSNLHRRTLINQLTSSFCIMLVILNFTLTNAIAFVHAVGPQNDLVCSVIVFGSNFFLTLGLLYLDSIIILRYLYIFRWKTVGAINDDLFALFTTINNVVISFLFCMIIYMMGYAYNVNYYFCTNRDPMKAKVEDLGDNFLKLNSKTFYFDIFCIFPASSYILHLFVFFRIFHFQRKEEHQVRDKKKTARESHTNQRLLTAS